MNAKVVRCADCAWTVGAIDLASAVNVGLRHSDTSRHHIDGLSIFAMDNRPAVNTEPKGDTTMVKTQKKADVKKWWALDELETAVPGLTAKLTAFWAAKHPSTEFAASQPSAAAQKKKATKPTAQPAATAQKATQPDHQG